MTRVLQRNGGGGDVGLIEMVVVVGEVVIGQEDSSERNALEGRGVIVWGILNSASREG